jgi:dTMP kinase
VFFDAIARAYDDLAAAEPGRFRILDASQPPDAVLAAALEAIAS